MDSEEAVFDPIRRFVKRHSRRAPQDDQDDIFASGYANSMFALQLVVFLETEFRFSIPDEELNIDNFRSISAMHGLVQRLRPGRAT